MKFSRKIGAEAWSIFTCGNAEKMVYIWCRRLCVCKLHWRKCSPAQPSPAQPNVGLHNVRAARTRHQRTLSCLLLTTTGDPSLRILLWLCWCWLNESGYHRGYQPSAHCAGKQFSEFIFCKSVFGWSSNDFRRDNFRILNLNPTPQQLCEGWFVISPHSLTEWQWQGRRRGGTQFPNPYMVTSQWWTIMVEH